ncbi:MAG: hypothetical protein GF308_11675 [Candidatus Heimdallarchaeota archaeon]|nr:hypothetical protein [Candidatus Heimdallarchaeota archaeon]
MSQQEAIKGKTINPWQAKLSKLMGDRAVLEEALCDLLESKEVQEQLEKLQAENALVRKRIIDLAPAIRQELIDKGIFQEED